MTLNIDTSADFTLAELMIAAASEAWRGDGELLGSGIGTLPRIALGVAKLTHWRSVIRRVP